MLYNYVYNDIYMYTIICFVFPGLDGGAYKANP